MGSKEGVTIAPGSEAVRHAVAAAAREFKERTCSNVGNELVV